jgi:hypothetical protein
MPAQSPLRLAADGAAGTDSLPAPRTMIETRHSRSKMIHARKSDGIDLHCFAGCEWRDVKAALRQQRLIAANGEWRAPLRPKPVPNADDDTKQRTEYALSLWRNSSPLKGTLGERYFIEQRNLDVRKLDVQHCLRWSETGRTVIALMRHPMTDTPCGIHRTFLNEDGTKRQRKMLGHQGVVKLTPDEDVILGIGITEGVEDGLAVLLSGWAPIWAATSANALAKFPIFHGIESLTVFADADSVGLEAAQVCVDRWLVAGREARISHLGGIDGSGN